MNHYLCLKDVPNRSVFVSIRTATGLRESVAFLLYAVFLCMGHLSDIYVELYKRGEWDKIPINKFGSKGEFGYLSNKQLYALELLNDNKTTHVGYGGSARSGKTIIEAFWKTMQCLAYPGVRYGLAREELKRLRTRTLPTFMQLWKFWDLLPEIDYKLDSKDHIYRFAEGSEIMLIETAYRPTDEDFLRFGGLELTACSVDESNESRQKAIDTLFTRTGWQKNDLYNLPRKILETFNPDRSHIFMRYYKPYKDNRETEKKKFIPALPGDNPHPSVAQWMEDVVSMGDRTLIERLINGNFEYDDDPALLIESFDAITDLWTNPQKKGLKYIVADVARLGSDKAIITVWDGLTLIKSKTFDISKTTEISECIKKFQAEYGVPNRRTLVDSDGVGGGVMDQVGCLGFINNSAPKKVFKFGKKLGDPRSKINNYNNLKSQCAFMLAEYINEAKISIACNLESDECESIQNELMQLKQDKIDEEGKKRLIPKKIMKANLGHSPDWMDCFIMRMYFELSNDSLVVSIE